MKGKNKCSNSLNEPTALELLYNSIRNNKLLKILLFLLIMILYIPTNFTQAKFGLDQSWVYALNLFAKDGLKFGSDVVFTYGPLGFLANTINIGDNLIIGIFFWLIIYIINLFLLYTIIFKDNYLPQGNFNLIMFYIFFSWLNNFLSWLPEYYILSIVIISLSLSWFSNENSKKYIFFTITCILTLMLLFFKFSCALMSLSLITLFLISLFLKNGFIEKKIVLLSALIPILFCIAYLIYNPSISGLINYIISAWEISSGYNTAMSVSAGDKWLVSAFIIFFGYIVIMFIFYFADKKRFFYMILFCGVLFFNFKHGFVRADGHVRIFFCGFIIFISIITLFIDFKIIWLYLHKKSKLIMLSITCLFIITWLPAYYIDFSPSKLFNMYNNKFNFLINFATDMQVGVNQEENKLPLKVIETVKQDTITFYPWDISYSAYNDINFVPFPTLQTYTAYTSYLDNLNAEFLNSEKKPEFIFLQKKAIDNRLPFIEVPKMWESIYNNYSAEIIEDDYLLLKKSDEIHSNSKRVVSSYSFQKSESLPIPQSENIILMSIDMELSFIGKITKFLFKIPEVSMKLSYSDGSEVSGRVLPEVLETPIIINKYSVDLSESAHMLNGISLNQKIVESLEINGKGIKHYKDKINVTFYEYDQKMQIDYSKYNTYSKNKSNNVPHYTKTESLQNFSVDSVNGSRYNDTIIHMKPDTFFSIQGWAADSLNKLSPKEVYIVIDDNAYKADVIARPDVSNYFDIIEYENTGYSLTLLLDNIEAGEHNVSLLVFSKEDGLCYKSENIGKIII